MKYVQRLDETVTLHPYCIPVRKMSRTFLAFQFVLIQDPEPSVSEARVGKTRDKVLINILEDVSTHNDSAPRVSI